MLLILSLLSRHFRLADVDGLSSEKTTSKAMLPLLVVEMERGGSMGTLRFAFLYSFSIGGR